jgi:hypothetical protein
MSPTLTVRQRMILLVVAVGLVLFWYARITEADIAADAAENLQMALNLKDHGTISMDQSAPFAPSMQREPLPIYVDMWAARALDQLWGKAPPSEYFHGVRARALKYQNILWLAVLSAAIFVMGWQLSGSFVLALVCVLASNLLLLVSDWFALCMLDSLLTESAAAALLAVGSLLLALGVRANRLTLIAFAGLAFGLLALVKAIFLYVIVGLAIAVPALSAVRLVPLRAAALQAVVLAFAALLVVAPWMYRNYHDVGYFEVSGRSGEALNDRVSMDGMTRDELLGSFYVWAPYPLNGIVRRILGYEKSDLARGGRLQRLNETDDSGFHDSDIAAELARKPEDAVTYYRRGRANMMIVVDRFTQLGSAQPRMMADHELRKRSLAFILHHPLKHAALSVAVLWRGAGYAFPLLAIAFVYGVRRRERELAIVVLPTVGLVLLYALATSFDTRFGMPAYPIAVTGTLALVAALSRRANGRGRVGW